MRARRRNLFFLSTRPPRVALRTAWTSYALSFEEWTALETNLRRLEHAVTGQPDLLEAASDGRDSSGSNRGKLPAGARTSMAH